MKYGNGKRGAVNGMRSNGSVDITSLQSEEMWIGITDAFASLMIYEVNKKTCERERERGKLLIIDLEINLDV